MGVWRSLAQPPPALPGDGPASFSQPVLPLFLLLHYHLRRLRARAHRARLALHARGMRGLLQRLQGPPAAAAAQHAPTALPALPDLPVRTQPAAAPRRLLLVDVSTPRPDRDSGSVRAFNLMRLLVDAGHAVTFVPDDRRHAGTYTHALEAIGVQVLHDAPAYPRLLRDTACDAVIISRYHLAEFLTPLIRQCQPRARIVLDTVDLHHLREAREAGLRGDRTLARLARITRRRELTAIAAADQVWVVSPHEARLLDAEAPGSAVAVIANVHALAPCGGPHSTRRDLLFVGGGQHPPNLDAVRWLARDILPQVRRSLPDCQVHLVGDGLAHALDGAAPTDGLVFHGHVPDLAPLLAGCLAGLAPLRFGAGVKGKVNQYMAAGLPVVSTHCGAEGMALQDGTHALLHDDADGFAAAIVALHHDPARWARLAAAGQDNLHRHFSFQAAQTALDAALARLFA